MSEEPKPPLNPPRDGPLEVALALHLLKYLAMGGRVELHGVTFAMARDGTVGVLAKQEGPGLLRKVILDSLTIEYWLHVVDRLSPAERVRVRLQANVGMLTFALHRS